jgi:hypothetical protein
VVDAAAAVPAAGLQRGPDDVRPGERRDRFRVVTALTAAYRLARDPGMPITDVQWVLGHASLTTTQVYVNPTAEDVIEATLAHHRRRAESRPVLPDPAPGYRPESLDVLFGKGRW